jgi:acyl carrier protein
VSGYLRDREDDIRNLILRLLKLPVPHTSALVRVHVPEWDSLKHMEIVFALEDRYGVQFDESEFPLLDSPASIAVAVRKHLAA